MYYNINYFYYTFVYKEEVILSEITYNLDSPESNQIKIQNYKTQFEDLFQRVTAATQSLQFQTGDFQRAAGAFNTNGSLNQGALQNSLINNSLTISNVTGNIIITASATKTSTGVAVNYFRDELLGTFSTGVWDNSVIIPEQVIPAGRYVSFECNIY